jgi:anti-anti-sigma factor
MPVTLDERAVVSVVGLEGEVDIRAAVELKGALLAALLSRQELRVELAGVTALDITTLQLLYAFEQAAAKAGTKLRLSQPMPEAMELAMGLAGLERLVVNP